MNRRRIERDAGFTLVELSVVLLLVSLVGAMAFSSYVLVSRAVGAWSARVAHTSDVHIVTMRILSDLYESCGLSEGDASWVLCSPNSSPVTYSMSGDTLIRNGMRMDVREGGTMMLHVMREAPGTLPAIRVSVTSIRGRDTTMWSFLVGLRNDPDWQYPVSEESDDV